MADCAGDTDYKRTNLGPQTLSHWPDIAGDRPPTGPSDPQRPTQTLTPNIDTCFQLVHVCCIVHHTYL